MSIDKLKASKKEYDEFMCDSRNYNNEVLKKNDKKDQTHFILKALAYKTLATQVLVEGLYNYLLEQEEKKNESK